MSKSDWLRWVLFIALVVLAAYVVPWQTCRYRPFWKSESRPSPHDLSRPVQSLYPG